MRPSVRLKSNSCAAAELLFTAGLLALLLVLPAASQARENVMLVLDASGSMWGQIDGKSKVEIAREAVAGLVADWAPENHLGLVAYGHRRRGDCEDIEVLIEPAPLDARAFLSTVDGLNARGMTPLSAAVIRAAEVLRSSEQKATVILVSDGEENCSMDPCAVGTRLAEEGVDFTAHVIGFDVADPAHQAQLRCLAENTGGRFLAAMDATSLANSLGALVATSTREALPAVEASLQAPDTVVEASTLKVGYQGPAERGDYVELRDSEGGSRTYAWVPLGQGEGQLRLDLPGGAGAFTLRYVSAVRRPAVLAERPLRITEAEAVIEAPESVAQGSRVPIRSRGPADVPGIWVGIAEAGSPDGSYLVYFNVTRQRMEETLAAPSEPGDYEIRYVLPGDSRILVRRPLRVSPAEVMVTGPSEVVASAGFTGNAFGPPGDGHWVAIARPDSGDDAYESWAGLDQGQGEFRLRAPFTPGDYELRYVMANPNRVMARQAVRVLPASVRFDAPAEVRLGQSIEFRASGPVGDGNYLTVTPAGAADGEYGSYQYAHDGGDYQLAGPEQAGEYELRFSLPDGQVIGRHRLRVLP